MKHLIAPTLALYQTALSKSWSAFMGSVVIIPLAVLLYFLFLQISSIAFTFGIAGRFLAGLLFVACLALYLGWIREAVSRGRIRIADLKDWDLSLFQPVMSVAFIFFLAELVLNSIFQQNPDVLSIISLIIGIVLNAIPEIIYQRQTSGLSAFEEAVSFIQENWIEWFLPTLFLLFPLLIHPAFLEILPFIFSGELVLFPGFTALMASNVTFSLFLNSSLAWLASIMSLIFMHFFVIFRGFLFQELFSSSRRSRAFRYANK